MKPAQTKLAKMVFPSLLSPLRPLRRVPRRGSELWNNSLNACDKGSAYLDRTLLALLILSSRAHWGHVPESCQPRRQTPPFLKKKKNNLELWRNSFRVGESSITLSQRFCFTVHIVSVSPGIKWLGGSCADNSSEQSLRLLKQLHLETPYNEYCILVTRCHSETWMDALIPLSLPVFSQKPPFSSDFLLLREFRIQIRGTRSPFLLTL